MSIRVLTYEDYYLHDGRHYRHLWQEIGDSWACPGCGRTKYKIMRVYKMKSLPFFFLFFLAPAFAQTPEPPKIIKEQNGNLINYQAAGNLASTQTIGCISLSEVKNTFTPADLYKGVGECIAKDNYDLATELFFLAGTYANFDAERITDKTAGQAKTVLIMNVFSSVPQDKKTKFSEVVDRLMKNPDTLGVLCSKVQKIGMPDYYPGYMILHGIKAFTGNPHDGALVKDFDAQKVWAALQTKYLHCPASSP